MIAETIGVICISLYRDSVLNGKLGKGTPAESRAGFKENLRRNIVLSTEDVNNVIYSYLIHYYSVSSNRERRSY